MLKPLGNRALVKRIMEEEKMGLILTVGERSQERATVISVGDGKMDNEGRLIPPPVAPGDVILLDKYSGQEITLNNEEYVIVSCDTIMGVYI